MAVTYTFANGLVYSIDPVMFRVGGLSAYWYGFFYSLGFAALWLWLWLQRRQLAWTAYQVSEACIIFTVGVLAGGRLVEVFVYEWGWYATRLAQIPMFWVGGMSTHGLLLGSVVGAVVMAAWTRTPLLRLLDVLSVAAAFIFGVGRIGNFIEGGVIGTPTDLPWGVQIPEVAGFRHPVSLYEGAKNLLLVPVLIGVLQMWPAGTGMATGCFLLGYGGLRFLIDRMRDYESVLFGLGPGQWFNLAMAVIGLTIVLVCRRRTRPAELVRPASAPSRTTVATRALLRPLRVVLVVALILFPLCIPNSWTTEYLHLKRIGDGRGSAAAPLIAPAR
jgi:phosphatidylglycerol:prolipoprotein diacylglycerol transferase